MMQKPDSVKPSKSVSGALELLVDFLLAEIKAAPVSPHDLLARLKASPPDYLGTVTEYMRSRGFLDGSELNSSALYHALKIDMATGVGSRVLLTEQSGSLALHYFPGYTSETPLRQFLMQEVPKPLTSTFEVKHEYFDAKEARTMRRISHRTLRTRERHVNRLISSLQTAISRYQSPRSTPLNISARELTIGGFRELPEGIVSKFQEVYKLLESYGFTSGTGLAKR